MNYHELCICDHTREWHLLGFCSYVIEYTPACDCKQFKRKPSEADEISPEDLQAGAEFYDKKMKGA